MNYWMPKKSILYIIVATTVFLGIAYFISFYFVRNNINKIADSYRNSDSESSKVERIWMIKALLESNKEQIQKVRQFFIPKEGEVIFIEKMENLAINNSVKFNIKSIGVLPKSNHTFFEEIKVSINFEGNWSQITGFINSLENMDIGIKVKSLTLESNSKDVWRGSMDFISYKEK